MANNSGSNNTSSNSGNNSSASQQNNAANQQQQAAQQQQQAANQQQNAANQQQKNTNQLEKLGSGMVNTGRTIVNALVKAWNIENERKFENVSADFDILMTKIDAMVTKLTKGVDMVATAQVKSAQSAIASIYSDINENAYSAASSKIDFDAMAEKFAWDKALIDLQEMNKIDVRAQENIGKNANLDAEKIQAWTTASNETIRAAGHAMNGISGSIFGIGGSTGNVPGLVADIATLASQTYVDYRTQAISWEQKMALQQMQQHQSLSEAQLRAVVDVKKAWIDSAASVEKAWLAMAQKLESVFDKTEQSTNDMGMAMGYTGAQLKKFKKILREQQADVVSKWNVSWDERQKMESGYREETGRNYMYSDKALERHIALGKYIGDESTAQGWITGAEFFNSSIEDSSQIMYKMMKDVQKIGLSGRKYAKDMVKNLQIAQKYQFKGGLKGMMQIAKWAQNVGYNMQNVSAQIDDIQKGGLEGIITKAAKLQVLGGRAAMGADPIAMMYEAFASPADLMKRYNGMLTGFGQLNSKTGEVGYSMNEEMLLNNIAELLGQDKQDLKMQINRRLKGEAIDKLLNPAMNLNEDEKSLVTNMSKKNKNGDWVVQVGREEKRVSDLTTQDMAMIRPQDTEMSIEKGVWNIYDLVNQRLGRTEAMQQKLVNDAWDFTYEQQLTRMGNVLSNFNSEYSTILEEYKQKSLLATESQATFNSLFQKGNSDISAAQDALRAAGMNMANTLNSLTDSINQALQKLAPSLANSSSSAAQAAVPNTNSIVYKKDSNGNIDYTKVDWEATREKMQSQISHDTRKQSTNKNISTKTTTIGKRQIKVPSNYNPRSIDGIGMDDGIISGNGSSMFVKASSVKPIHDGIISGYGSSMSVSAPSVKPIHDGVIAGNGSSMLAAQASSVRPIHDGMISGYGSSMLATGSSVRPINDGVIAGNGSSMLVSASNVRPINDGVVAQTDPNDHGIFAKSGGPFDTLFNGVLGQIDAVYELLSNSGSFNIGSPIKIEPLKIEGKLELTGNNGISIDLISELQNNPLLVRSLTQIITETLSKQDNGGRAVYSRGVLA